MSRLPDIYLNVALRSSRELNRKIANENLQLAEQQKSRQDYLNRVFYKNIPTAAFYEQFNKGTRWTQRRLSPARCISSELDGRIETLSRKLLRREIDINKSTVLTKLALTSSDLRFGFEFTRVVWRAVLVLRNSSALIKHHGLFIAVDKVACCFTHGR